MLATTIGAIVLATITVVVSILISAPIATAVRVIIVALVAVAVIIVAIIGAAINIAAIVVDIGPAIAPASIMIISTSSGVVSSALVAFHSREATLDVAQVVIYAAYGDCHILQLSRDAGHGRLEARRAVRMDICAGEGNGCRLGSDCIAVIISRR